MSEDNDSTSGEDESMRAEAIREFLVDLSEHFEREFIVIGGWAVHAYGAKNYSLDGDAMISYEVQGTLRDSYEVTKNARMHKEQFRCPTGDDIDLYVERQHRLPVPFAELQAYCRLQAGMWVACPEHLLILKLGAWRDRGHTPKGQKDRQDMINLLDRARTEFRHPELLAERLTAPDWEDLEAICADTEVTDGLREGNRWQGRALREELSGMLARIKNGEPPIAPVEKRAGRKR